MTTANWHAERLLSLFHEEALCSPVRVNLRCLLEGHGKLIGVEFHSLPTSIMGSAEGMYEPGPPACITLRDDVWTSIVEGFGNVERARATCGHELGHHSAGRDKRTRDEEEDAWKIAGCLLMPCSVVALMAEVSDAAVAEAFGVSQDFAYFHLKRMKRARML